MCRLSLPGTEGLVVQNTIYLNINLSMTEGERRPAEISVDGYIAYAMATTCLNLDTQVLHLFRTSEYVAQ